MSWLPTILVALAFLGYVLLVDRGSDAQEPDPITITGNNGSGPVTVTSRAPGEPGPSVLPPQELHITGMICNNTADPIEVIIEYRLRKLANGTPSYDIPYSIIGPGPLGPGCVRFDRDFALPMQTPEPGMWALVGNVIPIRTADAYHFETQAFRILTAAGQRVVEHIE